MLEVAQRGRKRLDPERLQSDVPPASRGIHYVNMKDDQLAALDAYKDKHGLKSRPAAIMHALEHADKYWELREESQN